MSLLATLTPVRSEEKPDPRSILETVRIAQSAQDRTLTGQIRTGPKKIPFTLTTHANTVKWEFQNPAQTVLVRLGEKGSTIEEITPEGKAKVAATRFDDSVRGTAITYEDLSLRFLYWQDAVVEGEQTVAVTKCWQVLVIAPSGGASIYSKVRLWIGKENGALLKCEAFGRDARLARTFRVISPQQSKDGLWMLKQMRIETPSTRVGSGPDFTYLEIDPDR